MLLASSSWVETGGADKHRVMHEAAPPSPLPSPGKNYPAQSINNAEVEKPCSTSLSPLDIVRLLILSFLIGMQWDLIVFYFALIN